MKINNIIQTLISMITLCLYVYDFYCTLSNLAALEDIQIDKNVHGSEFLSFEVHVYVQKHVYRPRF